MGRGISREERVMKCTICRKGESVPGKVTVTLERDGTTLIVKSVPVLVCENCGEEYVGEKVASDLLQPITL
jgi:YgiT-type zinc finger domain-containing protein